MLKLRAEFGAPMAEVSKREKVGAGQTVETQDGVKVTVKPLTMLYPASPFMTS